MLDTVFTIIGYFGSFFLSMRLFPVLYDAIKKKDFVTRFFGPKMGIPEDPVTGSVYCELIPYWSKRLNKKDMVARQLSKRGGVVYCSYLGDRVNIGGEATTYLQGELLLDLYND